MESGIWEDWHGVTEHLLTRCGQGHGLSDRRHMTLHLVHGIDHRSKVQPGVELLLKGDRQTVADGQARGCVVGLFDVAIDIGVEVLACRLLDVFLAGVIHLKHVAEGGDGHILNLDGVFLHPFAFFVALAVVHFAFAFYADAIVVIEVARQVAQLGHTLHLHGHVLWLEVTL